jgi:uncharacterized integral membrane protein
VSARRWLPAAGVTLLAAGFAWLNRGERVPVDLGLFRVYRAPLTVVAFLAFLAGMLSMMVLSLRHDRRVREELRRRGLLEVPPPAEPARPAASAWGVAREPAPPRADDGDRTVAFARDADDRTIAFSRDGDDPAAGISDDGDRRVGYPREDDDRTAAFSHDEDDRRAGYPRYDGDPAA